jgi:hypothetical protein
MAFDLIDRYLTLERMMMEADERGDEPFADSLRDIMDSIWYQLSDEEYNFLNNRGFLSITTLYPMTVSISDITFSEVPRSAEPYQERRKEWVVKDLRLVFA